MKFIAFLKSFTGRWFLLMSGPLTVPLGFAAVFVPSAWMRILFGLLTLTCGVFSAYRVWAEQYDEVHTLSRRVDDLTAVANAFQLHLEYYYLKATSDWESLQDDPARPLIVRNVSADRIAQNVSVLALVLPEGKAEFEPEVVAAIPPKESAEFTVDVEGAGVSPVLRDRLLTLLQKTYKDTSMEELVTPKAFSVEIQYEDASTGAGYITACEILYTRWPDEEIRTGKREVKRAKPSSA